jgi:hypothetical protein
MTRHRHCNARANWRLRIYRDTERARRKDAKTEALQSEVATEQERLAAHSKAVLAAPVDGQLWTVQVSPG